MKPRDFHILRNIILHKNSSTLFIVDRFSSAEELIFISNFVFNPDLLLNTIECALENKQIQPVLVDYQKVLKK